MFWLRNHPIPMIAIAGTRASGWVTAATMTGGDHATNGPKKGIAMRIPAVIVVIAA